MKLTVALFSALYVPHVGGVEVFTEGLARVLAQHGVRVVVVTNDIDGLPARESVGDWIEIVRLPCWPLLGGRLPMSKPGRCQREQLSYLRTLPIDAVVVNTRFYPHSLLGVRFARSIGLTPIVIEHGANYLTFGNGLLDRLVKLYEHGITALLKRFKPRFYGISTSSSRWLNTFQVDSCGEIPNALDVEGFVEASSGRSFRREYAISDVAILVAYTGRLIPEKGVEELVAAAELLANDGASVAFVLAGEGPLEASLIRRGVPGVYFTGRLNSHDVAALLLESDIFCFPSRSEGFGSSLLEAAACGNALVSTDVGIARDLVGEKGGVIINSAQPVDIAQAILSLVTNCDWLEEAQSYEQSRSTERYSWNECYRSLMEAIGVSEVEGAA